jgi:mycofactocin precursor
MLTDAPQSIEPAAAELVPSPTQPAVALREKQPFREKPQIEEEIIIEEVSIDGMCGVY